MNDMIEHIPHRGDAETFDDLPSDAQEALLKWLNLVKANEDDKARLLTLWNAGEFRAWRCPMCGEECFEGHPEEAGLSWDHFQGVLNPNGSFFSDDDIYAEEFIRFCCNTCRRYPRRFFPGADDGYYP
jgi:hypothetical protein